MAVRIPIYEDRLTPQGGVNVQARGVEVSDAVGRSMQQLGNTGASVAGVQMEILRRKNDADAVANLSEPLAQNDAYWPTRLDELAKASKDGGIVEDQDGNRVTITQQITKEFSDFRKSFLEGTTNEKARQLAQQHLAGLEGRLLGATMKTEANLGVQNRSDKVEQSVATWAKIAAQNPTMADQLVQSAFTMIANSGFDEHTRNQKGLAAQKVITESALTGAIQTRPAVVKSAIDRHYGGGFDGAVGFTMKAEGGYVANDAGKGESNFGINKTANPDVDVKNLTPEKAKEIYRARYWDKIGGDELAQQNPALAKVAFDTAVNMGVDTAKSMLAKAGGDVNKLLDLRQARYDELVKSNPKKFGQYQAGWKKRVADLRADAAEASSPEATSISSLVGKLDPSRVTAFENAATTEVNRQQAVVRSQLQATEANHFAQAETGNLPQNPLTLSEYLRSYPLDGDKRFANYQANLTLGSDMQAMKLQTPEQIQATLERYKPAPNSDNYAAASHRYAMAVKAADAVNAARQTDPVQYAIDTKIYGGGQIDWNNGQDAMAKLKDRSGLAATMASTYKTPFQMLSKTEAANLSAGMSRMTEDEALVYISGILKAAPSREAADAIFRQILPDSPVSGVAGRIATLDKPGMFVTGTLLKEYSQAEPMQVAKMILRGERLLNPNKSAKAQDGKPTQMLMPQGEDDKNFRSHFVDTVGKAFAGQAEQESAAYQAVRAYYAASMEKQGDYSGKYDAKLLDEAIDRVTGGVSDLNGKGSVRRPWGMPEDKFNDAMNAAFKSKAAEMGLTGKDAQFRNYGFVNFGQGYKMFNATGWVIKNGNYVVLDLDGKQQQEQQPATVPNAEAKMSKPSTALPKTK